MYEGMIVKNIFIVKEGFVHTSEVLVNPTIVEEQKFPFINQAVQLNQHIFQNPKGQVNFE